MNEKEIEFIKNNYKLMSTREIGKILGCSYSKVNYIGRKIGIRFDRYYHNIPMELFNPITEPEIAYLMGFLWADGYLNFSKKINKFSTTRIEIIYTDAYIIKNILNKFNIKFGEYHRYLNCKERNPQTCFCINDVNFANFLNKTWNFDKKSQFFPKLNLDKNLIKYFIMGYLDGDGHIAQSKIQFSAPFDYDWKEFYEILKSINITEYKFRKWISKLGHKASCFIINKKKNSKLFLDWLYKDSAINGLQRKFDKYLKYY